MIKKKKTSSSIEGSTANLSFSSEALLQQAIAGLLSRMPEITDVQILQGTLEIGKDIVFKIQGGFGEHILCACVVKNTRISGDVSKQGGARTIYFQAEQAFDSTYTNNLGRDAKIERVYIVTPYDLPPSTIASISGKLKERAGQVNFIGGARLFDLFKKYWPDYLADEATLIERHITQTKNLYVEENPLPSLAFQYSLGSVSSKLISVYVTHGFHREIRAYELGNLLKSSLPDPRIIERKLNKDSILRIKKTFAKFDYALEYLNEWGFCSSTYYPNELKESLDRFFDELMIEWEKSVDSFKEQKKSRVIDTNIPLINPGRFVNVMAKLINQRHSYLSLFTEKLNELKQTVASSKIQGIAALSDSNYLSACYMNECARAAPEGVFSYSNTTHIINFPQDILERWDKTLFIVGAPGFGKTSFCRWHALQDAEQFNLGKSDILPVYVPLHQFSRKNITSFEDTFLKGLGHSALLTKAQNNTLPRVRLYLDGLDEIASTERRKEVIELAKRGAEQHPSYHIVITSRDYIYGKWLDWVPKIYLSEFNDSEVKEFIDKWLGENSEINKQFHLQLRNIPTLYHLLRTPLLATLVIMVFRQTSRLPESKTRLYEVFIDLLSGGWDMAKGILRGSKFGQRIKVIILASLAGKLHTLRRREFSDREIKVAIESSLLGLSLKDWEILRDELIGDGLIGQSGGILYFSHLSFQEFLAAKDFMGSPHPTRSQRALELYLHGDDWWKEVLKFYISLSSNPEVVSNWLLHQLEHLKSRHLEKISIPHTLELLGCIVESFPEFPVEELARKMREMIDYNKTLPFLIEVQKRIFQN